MTAGTESNNVNKLNIKWKRCLGTKTKKKD